MDKLNKIERLKDELYANDYKVIKNYELSALDMPLEYDSQALHTERQAIRDKINQIEQMTDEEFYENYPEELEPVIENFESIEDYPDVDE